MRHIYIFIAVILIACVAVAGTAGAQANKPTVPHTATGTAFTYQGQIDRNGVLFTGTCDMQFGLWDDASAGTQQGTTLDVNTVAVDNGVFAVDLDFGSQFNGEARWLEVAVKCADDADFTTLPRTALSAVPYALSLMPGAVISGTTDSPSTVSVQVNTTGIGLAAESTSGFAIRGVASTGVGLMASSGSGRGVYATSTTGDAVFGTTSLGNGVHGNSLYYYGVYGESAAGVGVYATSGYSIGVKGQSSAGVGGYFESGVDCCAHATVEARNTKNAIGMWASTTGNNAGVYGQGASGVVGEAEYNGGAGLQGRLGPGVTSGYAGQFLGNVQITGTCCGAAANYSQIDHPLDPANKVLNQALVESPEMKNVYDGKVTTDEHGDAIVRLPDYVSALDRDFRYQLTVIGTFAQAIVSKEITNNQFAIKTDKPNVKVSWQVTGIRQDPYATANRIAVEQDKPIGQRGNYLHPEVYGLSLDLGIEASLRSAARAEAAPATDQPLNRKELP